MFYDYAGDASLALTVILISGYLQICILFLGDLEQEKYENVKFFNSSIYAGVNLHQS